MGVEEVMKFVKEKLQEVLIGLENIGGYALSWFDKVFPPETRSDKIHHWLHVAMPYAVAALILVMVVCCCRCLRCCCCGRSGARVRMMKAPGRNMRIPRSGFEADPRGYFRGLRAQPAELLC